MANPAVIMANITHEELVGIAWVKLIPHTIYRDHNGYRQQQPIRVCWDRLAPKYRKAVK